MAGCVSIGSGAHVYGCALKSNPTGACEVSGAQPAAATAAKKWVKEAPMPLGGQGLHIPCEKA